jgi:hypothetical protein
MAAGRIDEPELGWYQVRVEGELKGLGRVRVSCRRDNRRGRNAR